MIASFRTALLCACFALLTACAGLPPQQTYNREANAAIKTIQVLPMRESEVSLILLNNPAASFGLIGGIVAEADRASKQKRMRAGLTAANFDHVAIFKQAFTAQMAKRGYTLLWPDPIIEAGKSPRTSNSLRKSYAPVATVS